MINQSNNLLDFDQPTPKNSTTATPVNNGLINECKEASLIGFETDQKINQSDQSTSYATTSNTSSYTTSSYNSTFITTTSHNTISSSYNSTNNHNITSAFATTSSFNPTSNHPTTSSQTTTTKEIDQSSNLTNQLISTNNEQNENDNQTNCSTTTPITSSTSNPTYSSTSSNTNPSYTLFNNSFNQGVSFYPSYYYYQTPFNSNQFNQNQFNRSQYDPSIYVQSTTSTNGNNPIINQLIRNSFSNYDQSTDSEQYLINSYYDELSDHLENGNQTSNYTSIPTANTTIDYQSPINQQQDQQFILENYHHLNHNSNQIAANNHQYIYENQVNNNYYADYIANRENVLNLNSMIIFDQSLVKRALECIKIFGIKNITCILLVLIPVFLATILVLVFTRRFKETDKTDKDDLHQYAIYAFVIFSIAFLLPFGLFFFVVLIHKIIKKYKKSFNSNFIVNEFNSDLLNDANHSIINSTNLLTNHPSSITTNHLINTANVGHHLQHPQLVNLTNHQIDLQRNGFHQTNSNNLSDNLQTGDGQTANLSIINQPIDNQQISTLNVNHLQFSNNRQLIDEMIVDFDQMDQIDEERTLQRLERLSRLIRQNAMTESSFDATTNSNLIYYEHDKPNDDKPPSYELALLCQCPKRDTIGCNDQQQKLLIKTTKDDKKPFKSSSTTKPITVNLNTTRSDQSNQTSQCDQSNQIDTNNLQTELRNLENRRRSSNGSNTEPPSYDKLFKSNQ